MTGLIMPRRQFLRGLVGLVAAPAIVKIESLMPVRALDPDLIAIANLPTAEPLFEVLPGGDIQFTALLSETIRANLRPWWDRQYRQFENART